MRRLRLSGRYHRGRLLSPEEVMVEPKPKRKSGIPTGNAGEYFVMGELLRRGFDAQLADRNTKDYDLLVGSSGDRALRKVQVKSVREAPWYVNRRHFEGEFLDRVTIYVLVGARDARKAVRYFIARNREVAGAVQQPPKWRHHAFMPMRALAEYENRWDVLRTS
jgi:hypothetical protein